MATCSSQLTAIGHAAIRLGNERMSLLVLPDIAGKLIELTDLRSGRNWLWSNAQLPYAAPVYGACYDSELDSGGWDEVFPSITPGEIPCGDGRSRYVPDHGDLVGQPWRVSDARVDADGVARCALEAEGRALPFRWRRTLELDAVAPRLTLRYQIENRGAHAWPFLYCAHPLLEVGSGVRVEFPAGQEFRVDSTHGLPAAGAARTGRWPWLDVSGQEALDLSRCLAAGASARPFAAKVFVRSPANGRVAVVGTDPSDRLTFRYDPDWLPWVGLWINNAGWSGASAVPYRNLAVEPTTVAADSLALAAATGAARTLAPGERREWSLDVEFAP